jgi:hypothetical protein
MTGAQPVKGAVRLLRVVNGATRTAYGSRVQLTGVTRHILSLSLVGFLRKSAWK